MFLQGCLVLWGLILVVLGLIFPLKAWTTAHLIIDNYRHPVDRNNIQYGKTSHFQIKILQKHEMFAAGDVLTKVNKWQSIKQSWRLSDTSVFWWPYTPNTEGQLLYRALGFNCDPNVCFYV